MKIVEFIKSRISSVNVTTSNQKMDSMQRLQEEKQLLEQKIAQVNSSPHILMSNLPQSDCKLLLKPDSHEYYLFAMYQHTIIPLPGNNIRDILTQDGLTLYEQVLQKVKDGLFKDTFFEHKIQKGQSGRWFALENSPWFGKSEYCEKGIVGAFCTWQNSYVHGLAEKQGMISTSPCIFLMESSNIQDGWCYTKSGSLYKLTYQKKE